MAREGAARSDWSALRDAVREMGEKKSAGNVAFVEIIEDGRASSGGGSPVLMGGGNKGQARSSARRGKTPIWCM